MLRSEDTKEPTVPSPHAHEYGGSDDMNREQTANCGCHAATQTNDTVNLQRLTRELGQLIGKYLAEQPLNNKTSGVTRRLGVDAGTKTGTITQPGQIGEAVIGHTNHRHEDRAVNSKDSLHFGPSHAARHANQDEP